jgi:membrane associated rhomboid family serine protease
MFYPYAIHHNNEHYRFLTHAFIHGDTLHLGLNVFSLFMFGYAVEEIYFYNLFVKDPFNASEEEKQHAYRLAKLAYIGLFTGGIYAASVTEYFRNKNNPTYSSLGASGAIEAIIFSFIIINPFQKLYFFGALPLPAWLLGILFLAASFYMSKRKTGDPEADRVGHEAHFWGAIFGVIYTILLQPSLAQDFLKKIFG